MVTTDNLTLELIAKKATAGGTPGVNGGSPTTTWHDFIGTNDVTLRNTGGNFAWNDSGSGWDGDGTALDPYCLRADGTGDYGTMSCPAAMASHADFTLELWVYVATAVAGATTLFANRSATGGVSYYIDIASDVGDWSLGNSVGSTYIPDTTGVGYGDWQHHVLAYDATANRAYTYRNATVQVVGGSATDFEAYNATVTVFNNASGIAMALATLRVYDACLSAEQVTANYDAGVTAASTDLPYVWPGLTVTRPLQG